MGEGPAKFTCNACGKSYAWKPEFAGRMMKCQCGSAVKVPAAATGGAKTAGPAARPSVSKPAAPAPSREVADEFEDAFAGGEYEVAPPPEPVARAPVAPPGAIASSAPSARPPVVAASRSAPASPVLGYSAPKVPRKTHADEEEIIRKARITDLYVPIGLILLGTALSFVDAYIRGVRSIGSATVYVGVVTAVNIVLIFAAMLLAVFLINLGLGSVGTAVLKAAALGILPAAVASIVSHYTFGFITWGASALFYYLMLFYLFELDGQEMRIVATIIWLVSYWGGLLVLFLIVHVSGSELPFFGSIGKSGASQMNVPASPDSTAPATSPADAGADEQ